MVGGGDTAVEEAIYLTKYGTMVSLQSGSGRLCSIPEASRPGLPCTQAMPVHQGRLDTVRHNWDQGQVDHELCVIQCCLSEDFVYCFMSSCRQAT